jgi:glycosyltransferase involved in cell wall biosynthesis
VNVHIITLSPEPEDSLIETFRSYNITLQSLRLTRIQSAFIGVHKLKQIVSAVAPDIIHSQGLRPDLFCRFIKHSIKITTQRNSPFSDYPRLYGNLVGKLVAFLHIRVLQDLIVVACSKTINRANAQLGFESLVISNGVDIDTFSPLEDISTRPQLRKEIGLPDTGRLFVYSGPLIARKNIEYLIDTFKTSNQHNSYLIVLGSGPRGRQIHRRANKHPRIIFRDTVDDVLPYLQVADYFVSASLDEGLPNSVLEALATGVPVILSNIPSHQETLEHEPLAGTFFDPHIHSSLRERIDQLQNNPLSGNLARVLACTHFDSSRVAARYLSLYRKKMGLVNQV